MTLVDCVVTLHEGPDGHVYESHALGESRSWLAPTWQAYEDLRTQCTVAINPDALAEATGFGMAELSARLAAAVVPPRGSGNFDIVRSDFGESLAYLVLDDAFGTEFAYRSVRDRERIEMPGRGIDAVGVERTEPPTLVLCETKVSNEDQHPPGVVDASADGLRKQHLGHLEALTEETARKVWNCARFARTEETQILFFRVATLLSEGCLDDLRIVAACFLVRPQDVFDHTDFGTFHAVPEDFAPASVRFLVATVPGPVDDVVDEWANVSGRGSPGGS